jgi:hypothetical protein
MNAPCMHFVGFKDDRVFAALKVFGPPDFWHRKWDKRAVDEVVPGDWCVFADGDENSKVDPYGFDDSAVAPGKDCGDDRDDD